MEKIRIFIVDDNIMARSMLNGLLVSQEDFEVVGEAGTGQGGIIMLDEVNPDVVILETAVGGGMKITDVVKEIKNVNSNVKIILSVDAASLEMVMLATAVGADDFISKPYKQAIIYRVIRECVGK